MEDSPSDTGYRTGNLLLIETVEGQVYVTWVLIAHFSLAMAYDDEHQRKERRKLWQLPSSDYEILACGG
ncbi:uncharacterized protein N7483_010911 [Penicillium malachiteum]|uniref:uncharacterized protein n=1 Tax=Penicillium malachiteum TaxID=1324776 RepID=UPI0025474868|nr:uncharacterized protein N7483_010911 [Penicillium malachiteum]KAJ5713730.1 hypothetical protein N7483_010911 [Penicillium malachiteum]